MRQIQIERKLFELFGHKFFAFENFQDADLNIDDKTIYKYDNQNKLVDIFASNQFYTIWNDERRVNAGVICAWNGDISMIVTFLKNIGFKENSYTTFDCGLRGNPRVLFFPEPKAMQKFIEHLTNEAVAKKIAQTTFFCTEKRKIIIRRKSEVTQV